MKRQSSQRCLTNNLLRAAVPPALAVMLLAGAPVDVPAQSKDGSNVSQNDAKAARERAENLLKQAKAELKQGKYGAARESVANARGADPKTPGLDALLKDINDAEVKARAKAQADADAEKTKSASARVNDSLARADKLRRDQKFDDALLQVSEALNLEASNARALKLRDRIRSEQVSARERQSAAQVRALSSQATDAAKAGRFEQARRLEAQAREAAAGGHQKDLNRLASTISAEESSFNSRKNATEISRLLQQAETQRKAGEFDKARESAVAVYALDRENAKARKLVQRIEADKAKHAADRVSREAAQQLAAADRLAKAGKHAEARDAYKAILDADKDNRAARRGFDRANKQLSKATEAKGAAQMATPPAAASEAKVADKPAMPPAATEAMGDVQAEMPSAVETMDAAEAAPPPSNETKGAVQIVSPPQDAAANARAQRDAEAKARAEARARAEADARARREAQAAAKAESDAQRQAVASTESAPIVVAPPVQVVQSDAPIVVEPYEAESITPKQAERKEAEEAKLRDAAAREAERERSQAETERREQGRQRREQAERAYQEGVTLYNQGELARARQRWLDAKEIDSTFTRPDSYLENTEAEYNAFLANKAARDDFERREAEALEKMATLIAMSTETPLVLSEFLKTLRLFSGIDFVIAGEVAARVEVAVEDQPLTDVLNQVLTPIGLRWERSPGSSTVVITPNLRTEVFPLLPETLNTVDALIAQGVIARLLYGPNGQPILQGQEVMTDPRQNIVVLTDSEPNVEKFRRFLEGLRGTQSAQLIFKSVEIDERKAPEVKALLDAILSVDDAAPYNPERKLILEGSTLIIKDTPENIARVEEILQDEKFLAKFYQNTLEVATYNLTPVLTFEENPDLARAFAEQVQQVVATLLYAKEGRSRAESEGRRLFYDPASMQLTIVDYPDRLETVRNYVESLPQIRARRRSKIIFLDWANAGDLSGQIESFLGGDTGTTEASGDSVTKTLRREASLEFRGATFRVQSINANDLDDDTDDDVELYVRTGTNDTEETVETGKSTTFEDFLIVVEDIKPSNTPGEGRARIRVEWLGDQAGQAEGGTAAAEEPEPEPEPETGLQIVPVENLNALFVSYDNIEDLRDVEFWVKTLDIPTLQVSIEIKFVEVVSNKAKQLKSRLNFADLTETQSFSNSVLRSRFGQDRDEYGSVFEPLQESAGSANLLKGTTVFDFIVNNGAAPISIELRMLEAQGLINVVNGPMVTVLNNVTAEFEIERQFGIARRQQGATGGGNQNLIQPDGITPVDLSVTPNVTRAGNISLQVDIEMRDFDQNLGQLLTLAAPATGDDTGTVTTTSSPVSFANSFQYGVLRKQLETEVRIKDGGTVVLGGWRNERTDEANSGVPILSDIPFIGRMLFNRFQKTEDKITLLIFLTGQVVRD